jgi:hypothetical protein
MKTTINRNDYDYNTAVNYSKQSFYNPPVTITVLGKKFILGCGSNDVIKVKVRKGLVYIVGENSSLDYISLTVINPRTDYFDSLFCGNGELSYNPYNLKKSIFEYSTNYQIRVMSAYL